MKETRKIQQNKTETTTLKWDTQDDYYFTVINNIEINIRAYNKHTISIWIYDHDNNLEMIDDELSSLQEIQIVLNKNLHLQLQQDDLPTINQLLQLQQKQGA